MGLGSGGLRFYAKDCIRISGPVLAITHNLALMSQSTTYSPVQASVISSSSDADTSTTANSQRDQKGSLVWRNESWTSLALGFLCQGLGFRV